MHQLELEFGRLDRRDAERLEGLAASLRGVSAVDVWTSGRAVMEFDDRGDADAAVPVLAAAGFTSGSVRVTEVPAAAAGHLRLNVTGMHCRSCELLLEERLGQLPGVGKVRASAASGTADIEMRPGASADRSLIRAAVEKEGYSIGVTGENAGSRERPSAAGLAAAFGAAGVLVWLMFRYGGSPAGVLSGGPVTFLGAAVIGLVAGAHSCLAVSGGLLMSAAARFNEKYPSAARSGRLRPILLFVAGRVSAYAVLGGAIGWLGGALLPSPGVTGALILAAGLFMITAGLDMLGLAPRWLKRLTPAFAKPLGRRVVKWRIGGWPAPLLVGAATFFVPCGFTQALQIYALSTHSFAAGASALGGFALGTAPALFALGLAAGASRGKVGRLFFRLAGATVVLLGLVSLQSGMTVAGLNFALPRSGPAVADDLPPVVGGAQVIHMVVGAAGGAYTPDHFTVRAGLPVRWEIDQQASAGCLSFVVAQTLGINAPLKQGMNVVEFTPEKTGTYVFSCSMGMYRGTITVVPRA